MGEFYNELKNKYQVSDDEKEEEMWFSKKKRRKEIVNNKKTNKSLYSIIETFFNSLVDSEVEEQFMTFEEFIRLDFWKNLPYIIWEFFENIWLYSADDEEEIENALIKGEESDYSNILKL